MTVFNNVSVREFAGVHGYLESDVSVQLVTVAQLYYNVIFIFCRGSDWEERCWYFSPYE